MRSMSVDSGSAATGMHVCLVPVCSNKLWDEHPAWCVVSGAYTHLHKGQRGRSQRVLHGNLCSMLTRLQQYGRLAHALA